ncbi:MAG: DUF354 domain-containing protein [Bacteroidales bacterium]|nr:DUF354 domain-containing protein [Bacteroidales bacterium]
MNILIDIGHPAHVHLFRNLYGELTVRGHNVTVTVKDLPSATRLLDLYGIPYIIIGTRGKSVAGKGLNQIIFDMKLVALAFRKRIDLALGSSITIAHASRLSPMKSVVFDDDDDEVQPLMTRYGHPFAHALLSPESLRGRRRRADTIYHESFHELAYLHPSRFTPDASVLGEAGLEEGEPYFIMRFSAFKAHHDTGISGISLADKLRLSEYLSARGKLFITTEGDIEPELARYRLSVASHRIHSLMSYATMLVGDSQTMTSEAAVLGVPALRCNSFAGRIAYLEEQEKRYGLTYAYTPDNFNAMFEKMKELLAMPSLGEEWQRRRQIMLNDKIDLTDFMVRFIENYPESIK